MSNPVLPDDAVAESVARVHDELFMRLRRPRRPWRKSMTWSAVGLSIAVLFGGGLATGAAYANSQQVAAIPPGLLEIDCASGSTPLTEYFDTRTDSLTTDPQTTATADVQADPSAACTSEVPQLVSAIGLAIPGFTQDGHHCGTITVPGYPKAYFVTTDGVVTDAEGKAHPAVSAISFISNAGFSLAGPVATTDCVELTLPALGPAVPKLVSCAAASNNAVVYLDEKSAGAAALCSQHGDRVWAG